MLDKKVKITNPNNFMIGLKLMDGIREIPVYPNSFVILDSNEVFYINNMCTLFKRGMLIIEDDEINEMLGFTKNKVYNLTSEEIEKTLKGSVKKIKEELSDIKEKHIKDRIVKVAKEMDLPASKIKVVEEITGYNFEQLIENEE